MISRKQSPKALIRVADGTGGLREVQDHRFDTDAWPVEFTVSAAQAENWMAHLVAEMTQRGWSSSGLSQLDVEVNSGSLTLHMVDGQLGPTIDIFWEKERGGRLNVRARPGGEPAPPALLVTEFFSCVDDRLQADRLNREHRRSWLIYDGMPWIGELWLTDSLRLGPPSRRPPNALIGRQAVIVDAIVEGIGHEGVSARFQRLIRELRLVLSPILGVHLETCTQWRSEWITETAEGGRIADCRLGLVGYTEIGLPHGMPTPGAAPCARLETVTRPDLRHRGISVDDHAQRIPQDIQELWRAFIELPLEVATQFLNACNAYAIARSMWPDQRTAYAVFLVIACEALKPAGRRHDKANAYDVVASLIDAKTAESLRALRVAPQTIRSKHVHRGSLVADEMAPLLFGDPFRNPAFDETITTLAMVTPSCLIEWLRRGGRYELIWLPREGSTRNSRKPR